MRRVRDGYGGSIRHTRTVVHLRIPVIVHTGMSSTSTTTSGIAGLGGSAGNWSDLVVIDTVERIAQVWRPMDAAQRDGRSWTSRCALFRQELQEYVSGWKAAPARTLGLFPRLQEQEFPMDAVLLMLREIGGTRSRAPEQR